MSGSTKDNAQVLQTTSSKEEAPLSHANTNLIAHSREII